MNKIDRQLRTLDPVRLADLVAVSAHPVFDELLEAIVASPPDLLSELTVPGKADLERLEPIVLGRHAPRGYRRPFVAAIAGVAAVLVVVAGLAVQSPGHSKLPGSSRTTAGSGATTGPVAAPKWRLVGDITPAWRTESGTGYEPGLFLACPTTTTCYADNLQQDVPGTSSEIEVTHDGGNSWQQSNLPVTLSDATPLACVDAETCATLGIDPSGNATFLETSDGGATWASLAGPSQLASSIGVTVLACTTAESCVAVASDPADQSGAALAFVTNDGGATWSDSVLPTDFVPTGLQCVSGNLCVASGFSQSPDGSSTIPPGTVLYSSDDGATWAAASVPPGLGPLGRVSCVDSTDCVASFFGDDGSSSQILASTDGGQSWSEAAASGLPAAFVTGLSCPTAAECWAAGMVRVGSGGSDGSGGPIAVKLGPGAEGIVASSSDDGQTWQVQQLPQGVLVVLDITCPSDTSCYAVAIQTSTTSGAPASFVLLAYGG
jgi:photosystem II stability/assembly factor-like uncharacterized protein